MLTKSLISAVILLILGIGLFFLFNPLEKLRESRDDQRIADLNNLKKAIDLYTANNSLAITAQTALLCSSCSIGEEVFSYRKIKLSSGIDTAEKKSTFVSGSGWVPLDLSLNAKLGQTPLKLLPLDPLEKGYQLRTKLPFLNREEDFVYTYSAGLATKYKLTAKMESQKGLDKAKNDSGAIANRFEIGTDLSLQP